MTGCLYLVKVRANVHHTLGIKIDAKGDVLNRNSMTACLYLVKVRVNVHHTLDIKVDANGVVLLAVATKSQLM